MATVADLDLEKLWKMSQAYTVARFRARFIDTPLRLDEMKSQASETFVKFVEGYDEWCARHGYGPAEEGLFYTLVKKQINWDCLTLLKGTHELREDELDDPFGNIRTQLRVHNPESLLHHHLASFIPTLHLRERLYLALVVFEELPVGRIADLSGSAVTTVGKAIRTAAERVLMEAMRMTVTDPIPAPEPPGRTSWEPPTSIVDRLRHVYGCDVDTYLAYVQAHYRADVSYMVEILDRGNGGGPQRGNRGNNRKLNDEQVRGILTRLREGEKHDDIAKDYGVTRSAISYLKKAHGVAA